MTFGPAQPIAGMILIPAGVFEMGSNAAAGAPYFGDSKTTPVHIVTLAQDYWIAEPEASQGDHSIPLCMS